MDDFDLRFSPCPASPSHPTLGHSLHGHQKATSPPYRASSAMPSALYEEQQTPNHFREQFPPRLGPICHAPCRRRLGAEEEHPKRTGHWGASRRAIWARSAFAQKLQGALVAILHVGIPSRALEVMARQTVQSKTGPKLRGSLICME